MKVVRSNRLLDHCAEVVEMKMNRYERQTEGRMKLERKLSGRCSRSGRVYRRLEVQGSLKRKDPSLT